MRSRNDQSHIPTTIISRLDVPDHTRDEDIQAFLRNPSSVRDLLRKVNKAL
jgi:hypothetical protein